MSNDIQKAIFSRNLNYFLQLNRKSQKEVADTLGISLSTFNSWCTGTKIPRMDKIQKLADYFGIKKSDLIDDKTDNQTQGYYINEETRKIAQKIYENPALRILFDASRDAKPEDLLYVADLIKRLKAKENHLD